jgi:hypothetical protein
VDLQSRNRTRPALISSAVGAALGVFLLAGAHDAVGGRGAIGTVTYVAGNCRYSKAAGGTWGVLKAKQNLFQGPRLKTEENSRLEAKLSDGSMIRLGAKSELTLDKVGFKKKKKKEVKVKLVIGRIWASVTKLFGSDSKFEVETENAVAGVRGTRFAAARDASGTTTVRVYSGAVLVSNEPIYKIKGHTKGKRVEVQGPQEISKEQWEKLIAEAMQQVQVAASGAMTRSKFAKVDQKVDDWEAWNEERDRLAGLFGE